MIPTAGFRPGINSEPRLALLFLGRARLMAGTGWPWRRPRGHIGRWLFRPSGSGGFHLLGEGFGHIRWDGALHGVSHGLNAKILRGSLLALVFRSLCHLNLVRRTTRGGGGPIMRQTSGSCPGQWLSRRTDSIGTRESSGHAQATRRRGLDRTRLRKPARDGGCRRRVPDSQDSGSGRRSGLLARGNMAMRAPGPLKELMNGERTLASR